MNIVQMTYKYHVVVVKPVLVVKGVKGGSNEKVDPLRATNIKGFHSQGGGQNEDHD